MAQIARWWHGWTTPENADAYEALLRAEVLPGIDDRMDGFEGAYVLRTDREDESEFATLTLWASWDAVRAFGGEDWEVAVVPPAAREPLDHFDERSLHYEIRAEPSA